MKKIKFLILTMGPGETIQGTALANYVLGKKNDVTLAARMRLNYRFLRKQKQLFKVCLVETEKQLKKVFEAERPDVFVLCNSKIVHYYKDFFLSPPSPKPVTVSLDSNWLFLKNEKWYSFIEWADRYLIVFPKKIFNLGLKKYGGDYNIPAHIIKKIETVGFIPSFKKISLKEKLRIKEKYKIGKNEKLIFSYFGGFGAGFHPWALDNLIKAVEYLNQEGCQIKIILCCRKENVKGLEGKSWLIIEELLSDKEFFSILSSSDLVFQHQGLGTLAQAISSQIPVIANVRNIKDEPYPGHAHAWEVGPFAKLNMCKMLLKNSPLESIEKGIKKLLYGKKEIERMKNAQKKYYAPGEPATYKIIKGLLKTKIWKN